MKFSKGQNMTHLSSESVTCLHLLSISFVAFGLNVTIADAQELDKQTHLAAFSLTAAQNAILSGTGDKREIYTVGFITNVWAVLLDDQNDLILVGERDASIPDMHLDDVATAIRTKDKLSGGENPGVSIEPINVDRYTPTQKVIYYGGIDSTHYGGVCFEADLLLKRLSLGFEATGIEGFPSEWDLELDNVKAGRRIDPWGPHLGRSWFFPLLVRIAKRDKCAAVTAVTMHVRTDLDEELEMPEQYLDLDESSLAAFLQDTPEATPILYARLFTQHYDEIAQRFPVLKQLQNLLALSGLIVELSKESAIKDLDFWLNEYEVQNVKNPTEVPTLSRGVNGPGYNSFISGGVRGFFVVEDGWTEAVLSRKPKYLRQAALMSRPSPTAVSWVIPLELGAPQNWSEKALRQAQTVESERLSRLQLQAVESEQTKSQFEGDRTDTQFDPSASLYPVFLTPGWHPNTEGENLFAFRGRFHFGYGGFEAYSPDGRFSVSGAEISAAMPLSLQYIYKNRVDLELTLPLALKMNFLDIPSGFLLLNYDAAITYAVGIESPIISSRFQLMNGIKNGRWRLPAVILENSFVLPLSNKAFDGVLSGPDELKSSTVSLGSEHFLGSHGLQTTIPVSYKFRLAGSLDYQTDWKGSSLGDRIIWGFNTSWLLEKETATSLGFHFLTSSVKSYENSSFDFEKAKIGWVSQGQQLLASFSFPTRNGLNSILLGWYFANSDAGYAGNFIVGLDLRGTSLWDLRRWF